jgi:hypothetical protein
MKQNEPAPQVDHQYFRALRIGIGFLLCSLMACFGSLSYHLLMAAEVTLLRNDISSTYMLINQSVNADFTRIVDAADVVNNLFGNAIENNYGGTFPNLTLPGFESTINSLRQLSGLQYISYSPLITNITRASWETYAKDNVRLLNGPLSLITATTNGISNLTSNRQKVRDTGYIDGSPYPTALFPVWQVAPIYGQAESVMVDLHALVGNARKGIDRVLATKKTYITEASHLLSSENASLRPEAVIFSPILSLKSGNPIVGLFTGGFGWDQIFNNITLSSVYVVLHADDSTFTFNLNNGVVSYQGKGNSLTLLQLA